MAKPERLEPQSSAPPWMTTYNDVVTLLMTFFVLLLTFSKTAPQAFETPGGRQWGVNGDHGIVGSAKTNALVQRPSLGSWDVAQRGSEMPPIYSDPSVDETARGLAALAHPDAQTLSESHMIRIPRALLFDGEGRLTGSGLQELHRLARNVIHLPYDLHVFVDSPRNLPEAVQLAQHMVRQEALHFSRFSVGVWEPAEQWEPSFWLLLERRG